MDRTRKIAIPDFYGYGEHVYTDELGFRQEMKAEARSLVAREVFKDQVEEVGLNLAFYDPVTDKFYGIHRENVPCVVKILPRNFNESPYIGWQCDSDTHDEGEIIASFDDITCLWDNLRINNEPFEKVLLRSYITALN